MDDAHLDMDDSERNQDRLKIHLSLGSNVGDREEHLASAIKMLKMFPDTEIVVLSDMYLADPVGEKLNGYFLNVVACIETNLKLYEIHKGLLEIEQILGKAKSPENGNRTIDIDIIFAGDFAGTYNDLRIPHPEYKRRDFVLMPLREIEETLTEKQRGNVRRYLEREKEPDAPLCLRYKKMVY